MARRGLSRRPKKTDYSRAASASPSQRARRLLRVHRTAPLGEEDSHSRPDKRCAISARKALEDALDNLTLLCDTLNDKFVGEATKFRTEANLPVPDYEIQSMAERFQGTGDEMEEGDEEEEEEEEGEEDEE